MSVLKSQTNIEKKLFGRVYTPDFIVEKILNDIGFIGDDSHKTIVDPACGDGQFLKEIVIRILSNAPVNKLKEALHNVYGWDIDKTAVQECRNSLNELLVPHNIKIEWNISEGNSLDHLLHSKFDYIVGNPPYVRVQNLTEDVRFFLKANYKFCSKGSTDLYIAFFELASKLLKKNGKCAYITPNSYFVSDSAYQLRKFFEEKKNILQITNYKNELVFNDASTYSAITIFDNSTHSDFLYQESNDDFKYESKRISFKHLSGRKFWYLTLSNEFLEIKEGQRLGDICQISVGIATLADWAYIVKVTKFISTKVTQIENKRGKTFLIEKAILKPIIKASKLKSTDDVITEFIIYPYFKNSNGRSEIISEDFLKKHYPLTYEYFLQNKESLQERDKGKENPVAWYAFGRTQSMDSSIGEKIVFSPMKKKPNFIISQNPEGLVYSGYYIKFDGDYKWLLDKLNSKEMEDYLDVTGRYFRHGWRGLTKRVLEDFVIATD
ncbi:HsdM family class I SAM-dependent methyltransferase [Dyadobacter frigoris]|uniref:site-specific DNA-methyltransferase (adenine-specific) n=1 Tax=Dyadobacter frigoris TaxID=2576211 RepID=A0A4U6CUW1_9BACT|nr:N-6 DNA methylase [Dyadobacter frigoris]TKT87427.1 methyltransferase domain-containing protein [Dyadobacter frigoris]GLU52323.1 DNA methyltransferase [Dyadobacter frigoris]